MVVVDAASALDRNRVLSGQDCDEVGRESQRRRWRKDGAPGNEGTRFKMLMFRYSGLKILRWNKGPYWEVAKPQLDRVMSKCL
jgi:hypothetical protein